MMILTTSSFGGRDKALAERAQEGLGAAGAQLETAAAGVQAKAKEGLAVAEGKATELKNQAKAQVDKITR